MSWMTTPGSGQQPQISWRMGWIDLTKVPAPPKKCPVQKKSAKLDIPKQVPNANSGILILHLAPLAPLAEVL